MDMDEFQMATTAESCSETHADAPICYMEFFDLTGRLRHRPLLFREQRIKANANHRATASQARGNMTTSQLQITDGDHPSLTLGFSPGRRYASSYFSQVAYSTTFLLLWGRGAYGAGQTFFGRASYQDFSRFELDA